MNGYCIAATSEHIDAAADFIAFAVDGAGRHIAAASGARRAGLARRAALT